MSVFTLYKYSNGDSSHLPNGVAKNEEIFFYDEKNMKYVEDYQKKWFGMYDSPNEIDKININKLKKILGLEADLRQLDVLVKRQWAKGNPDQFIINRGALWNKLYYKLCNFILGMLHDLYWCDFWTNNMNWNTVWGIDINDAFKLMKPAFMQLLNVLDEQLEAQFPIGITLGGIQQAMKKEKIDLKYELNPLGIDKNKKKE